MIPINVGIFLKISIRLWYTQIVLVFLLVLVNDDDDDDDDDDRSRISSIISLIYRSCQACSRAFFDNDNDPHFWKIILMMMMILIMIMMLMITIIIIKYLAFKNISIKMFL